MENADHKSYRQWPHILINQFKLCRNAKSGNLLPIPTDIIYGHKFLSLRSSLAILTIKVNATFMVLSQLMEV
jgi:hypothetical protein